MPLPSTRPMVIIPGVEYHSPLAKLYRLVRDLSKVIFDIYHIISEMNSTRKLAAMIPTTKLTIIERKWTKIQL